MKLLRLLNLSLERLPTEEQYNFLLLLVNILIVINTYTKETFTIYNRYLQVLIKHINKENKARYLLESPFPEDIIEGKLTRFKCEELFKSRIELYHEILSDIEGITGGYNITEEHFISYHSRYMIENERVAADLLNLLSNP
jgi:hypothetical protein